MRTKILTFALICFAFLSFAQTTTLNWSYVSGSSTYNNTQIFDWQYGMYDKKPVLYKLAIEKDGNLLYGSDALNELEKPIYGDGSQTFSNALPVLTNSVPQYLHISAYPWFNYNDTIPEGEAPKGYECKTMDGRLVQGVSLGMLQSVYDLWTIVQWRPFNPTATPIFSIPNPLYPIIEEQRKHEKEMYVEMISSTFIQTAEYTFPAFKLQPGSIWKLKTISDTSFVTIPYDPDYWLVSKTRYSINIRKIVREKDLKDWNTYMNNTILLTGIDRVKALLK